MLGFWVTAVFCCPFQVFMLVLPVFFLWCIAGVFLWQSVAQMLAAVCRDTIS
jgi:hypothetical protein